MPHRKQSFQSGGRPRGKTGMSRCCYIDGSFDTKESVKMKKIAFIMDSIRLGEELHHEMITSDEFEVTFLTYYNETERKNVANKIPDILVMEVVYQSPYPLERYLAICDRFKQINPFCNCILLIHQDYLDKMLFEVLDARWSGRIDSFVLTPLQMEHVVYDIRQYS